MLDDIGLEAALEQYCEEFQQRSGIATNFSSRNVPESVQREVASNIYHIAQECLRNVAKHAQTKTVSVTIEFADEMLRLIIKDQGVGLKPERPEASGIGIVAMRERAHLVNGKLSIQSRTGAGTEVSVEVPVSASAGWPFPSNQEEFVRRRRSILENAKLEGSCPPLILSSCGPPRLSRPNVRRSG